MTASGTPFILSYLDHFKGLFIREVFKYKGRPSSRSKYMRNKKETGTEPNHRHPCRQIIRVNCLDHNSLLKPLTPYCGAARSPPSLPAIGSAQCKNFYSLIPDGSLTSARRRHSPLTILRLYSPINRKSPGNSFRFLLISSSMTPLPIRSFSIVCLSIVTYFVPLFIESKLTAFQTE